MGRSEKKIAERLLAWIAELQMRENGMRTDSWVEATIRGIDEGNTLALAEALEGEPEELLTQEVADSFAALLGERLHPDGACQAEEITYEVASVPTPSRHEIRFSISYRLAYPD